MKKQGSLILVPRYLPRCPGTQVYAVRLLRVSPDVDTQKCVEAKWEEVIYGRSNTAGGPNLLTNISNVVVLLHFLIHREPSHRSQSHCGAGIQFLSCLCSSAFLQSLSVVVVFAPHLSHSITVTVIR